MIGEERRLQEIIAFLEREKKAAPTRIARREKQQQIAALKTAAVPRGQQDDPDMGPQAAYRKIKTIFKRDIQLKETQEMLETEDFTNPEPGNVNRRQARQNVVKALRYNLFSNTFTERLFRRAGKQSTPDSDKIAARNMALMSWHHLHTSSVPPALNQAYNEAIGEAQAVFETMQEKNDFAGYTPYLEKLVTLAREVGKVKAIAMGVNPGRPYQAFLDQNAPGIRESELNCLMEEMKAGLVPLARKLMAAPPKETKIQRMLRESPKIFPEEKQRELDRMIIEELYTADPAGLRIVDAPFRFYRRGGQGANDLRIGQKYSDDFTDAMNGLTHELGHANQAANVPQEYRHQAVGQVLPGYYQEEIGAAMFEIHLGRNPGYLDHMAGRINEVFGLEDDRALSGDDLLEHYTRTDPQAVWYNANEVLYPLQVILRTEIERDLINGDIEVRDLPRLWNKKAQELGLPEPGLNHREGVLQDPHWSLGFIGYFPVYNLAFLASVQINKGIEAAIERDEDGTLTPENWRAYHQAYAAKLDGLFRGGIKTTDQMLEEISGESLNTAAFMENIRRRYDTPRMQPLDGKWKSAAALHRTPVLPPRTAAHVAQIARTQRHGKGPYREMPVSF